MLRGSLLSDLYHSASAFVSCQTALNLAAAPAWSSACEKLSLRASYARHEKSNPTIQFQSSKRKFFSFRHLTFDLSTVRLALRCQGVKNVNKLEWSSNGPAKLSFRKKFVCRCMMPRFFRNAAILLIYLHSNVCMGTLASQHNVGTEVQTFSMNVGVNVSCLNCLLWTFC